jgi:hypothetical protein
MSNINDLYKESGITPHRSGQEQKSPQPPRKNGNYYIISLVLAFVIFAGIMLVLDSNGLKHPATSMRGSAIYIVPLTYVINLVIKLFKRLFNNINN